ncbi:septin and tuftelin-interacting protein 1 homolog 1-like [Chenopodium quinoa]|uniref:G-patch domain-containing protein n=1 Tax=Chenopodium quinoa TaxID=63459 RepID=A0A803LLM5_CHEQI|nr:septin and tuftelin-interacting protein 1 homolog 1-like [Chenopodium quinoa]
MDEYQKTEEFDMDNDFVDLDQFIENESFYRKPKRKFVQSNNDVLFDNSDSNNDDEDEIFFRKNIKKKSRRIGGLTDTLVRHMNPVNFASSYKDDLRENNVGGFEKYTKGIGMKLLQKMGYSGGGLGKNEQGIVAPIEAKLRPKLEGLGYNDHKRETEVLWKERGRVRVRADKVHQDIVVPAGKDSYDMPMQELQYNVGLVSDLMKLDVENVERKLMLEKQTVVSLQEEKGRLQKESADQKKEIDSMEEIIQVLDSIEEENVSGKLTSESVAESFRDLQRRFPEEYKLGNLSCIACSFAVPLLTRVFQGWEPLQNPWHGMDVIALWKGLLQGDGEDHDMSEDATAPYSQLVAEVVFPAVRIAGLNSWQARDPEPMLRFIELWEELLTPFVLQSLLDMIVMPKLSEAVNSWEPCRETIPIHVWMHPWLPLLSRKLETLHQAILVKFENALCDWHPSDMSAYTILSPWKTVFDSASWEKLIVRSILPKLKDVMQEFRVNPANQKLEQFNWVMTWASAIPIRYIVSLLENHFFGKWQQALHHWLCTSKDYKEIEQWYLGWKQLIPADVLATERVRRQLWLGLKMIYQSLGSEEVHPGVEENISPSRVPKQRQYAAQQHVTAFADSLPKNLKEVIEVYAQQQGLHFKPKPGRTHDDHQVYSFGIVSIIVDSFNQKIFARVQEKWSLVTLGQLVQMQNISTSRRR